MELKHFFLQCLRFYLQLLIVPYGIETVCRQYPAWPPVLLIVPYGIETL